MSHGSGARTASDALAASAVRTAADMADAPAVRATGAAPAAAAAPRLHLPSLGTALAIMLVGTLYPPLMADAAGQADHRLAMALFWAMSAGFVRGIGFVPRQPLLRGLYSGWSCALALAIAAGFKFGPALGLGA